MGIDQKTLKRWKVRPKDKRVGPIAAPRNKLTVKEREEVLKIATSKEFQDLSPCQIVPKLADRGVYIASESTFYRLLKEKKLLTHRGKSKAKSSKKPKPLIATGINKVWTWDITYLRGPISGTFFYLYMFIDIFSRKIVGWEVHEKESMDYSSQLVNKICIDNNVPKHQLVLHSDNGGSMKGATMLTTLQKLGVVPSFSRPRVSDDNPYSESLFKTLKYCPEYPSEAFNSLDDAREWVKKFVSWYNIDHLHSGIKFVTPASRHNGEDNEILLNRKKVYKAAQMKKPYRWSTNIRNWERILEVPLNYLKISKATQ